MPDEVVVPQIVPTHRATATTGGGYELPVYPFVEPAELGGAIGRHPVVIVGAGLTGLSLACALALRGVPAVVLDEDDTVGVRGASSRGICHAQKTLEIFAHLGIYERVAAKGVQWSVGRTFAGNDEVYSFDLKQQRAHDASEQPPFVNLQQFYVEWFLVDRLYELGVGELRWKNRVIGIRAEDDAVHVEVDTPAGRYWLATQWLIDCSGAHSRLREWLQVEVDSNRMIDRWCISDVRFDTAPPAERWTWIEAPFNEQRAVWQHLMADGVWRLDYQMPPNADPESVSRPDVVDERLRRQFGDDVRYELVWVGPYAYRSECLQRFRVGRVFFAGDAAHVMSPFGARGGNSGVQDADNLAWKLALVLEGKAQAQLLDTYASERRAAALENIRITRRTTRFLSPPDENERAWRDAVISLAREYPFARSFVNTGRLSAPTVYRDTPLNVGADGGKPLQNVALQWPDGSPTDLVQVFAEFGGAPLVLLCADAVRALATLRGLEQRFAVRLLAVAAAGDVSVGRSIVDAGGKLLAQLGVSGSAVCIVRPDLYLAGRLDDVRANAIEDALARFFGESR